jgi:hypothetical protein
LPVWLHHKIPKRKRKSVFEREREEGKKREIREREEKRVVIACEEERVLCVWKKIEEEMAVITTPVAISTAKSCISTAASRGGSSLYSSSSSRSRSTPRLPITTSSRIQGICKTSTRVAVVRSEAAAEVAGTQPAAIEDREQHETVVQNGSDRLQICRVVNGMWQTSGGWGKIERDQAVDAMLRHVDAGFTTFDMADHCMFCLLHAAAPFPFLAIYAPCPPYP